MVTKKVFSNEQLTAIGRRHGSTDVQKEASEAEARWRRDLSALKSFGLGQAALDRLVALRAEHNGLLEQRPDAVAHKTTTVAGRNSSTAAGWLWVDQVGSTAGELAQTDATFADELRAAYPDDDGDLPTAIPALAKLVEKRKADLPADADLDARLAEAPALAKSLTDAPGEVATAKSAPVIDTAEIDLLDGKLYIAIRNLNSAGKKAARHKKLTVPDGEYTFHHLNQRAEAPTPPTPPA